MHLTIVSPYPPTLTGISQYGYHISRHLAQTGVFSQISILSSAAQQNGLPAPLVVEQAWRVNHAAASLQIATRLQALQPDLVWFNLGASIFGPSPMANLSGFLAPGLARTLGFSTVVTLHELVELADLARLRAPGGPLARLGARLLTRLATRADVVCLTMRHFSDWLQRRMPQVASLHIPIGAYQPAEMLPVSSQQELLFFTSLAPFKGLELLLSAFAALQPEYPQLRLTVAGTPHPRFPRYPERIRRAFAGLPGVRWLGAVPEAGVRRLFEQAQIVVLPYLASTGSSSVLYQAAMWGRPLVVSDLPEFKALAAESCLKINFFSSGSAAGLAARLRELLDSEEARRSQARHNLNAIRSLSPEHTARRYLMAFNRALEIHNSPNRISVSFPDQP